MRARAASTQATRDRIIGTMLAVLMERWYDEVTLRDLAEQAGVALQTVVNHFGTKEGVLAALLEDPRLVAEFGGERFRAQPGEVDVAVELLVRDYERSGDAVIRFLALESRVPSLGGVLAFGRTSHRKWVESTFGTALQGLEGNERERRLLLLICATDVYTWQILRRDQGLSRRETVAAITELVQALDRESPSAEPAGIRRRVAGGQDQRGTG
jgi:AcrR family transcriptional regulator